MLYFVRGTDLFLYHTLAQTMFQDRKIQFADRLRWPVQIDHHGYERDQYDAHNPVYVIVAAEDGKHIASLRLLPTTGATMINDHFLDTIGGVPIVSKDVWECTRLCLRTGAPRDSVPLLLAATGYLMQELQIGKVVGVFGDTMLRQYSRLQAYPEIIGSSDHEKERVHAGLWSFSPAVLKELTRRSGVRAEEIHVCLANSLIILERSLKRAS